MNEKDGTDMKICEIRDESAGQMIIGYLFYYEKSRTFAIELSDKIDEKEAPLFLSSFIRKGQLSVDPEWSARWVRQRIVPTDRQNLGMILRENRLKEYDAYRLLMLGKGRCAQDDCSVLPVKENQLSEWVIDRRRRKLEFAAALGKWNMLLVFCDGTIWKVDLEARLRSERRLNILLSRPEVFHSVKLLPGGNGISWGEGLFVTAEKLYKEGVPIPLDKDELLQVVKAYILDTTDVCRELNCSRQYVNQLVQKNELACLKESGNNRLYARSEVERMKESYR